MSLNIKTNKEANINLNHKNESKTKINIKR